MKQLAFAAGMICVLTVAARGDQQQQPQVPTTIAGSVGRMLMWAERDFLSLAEAMPEDKYNFVPTQGQFAGVRSFGEQVKHVACGNFAFFNQIEGKTPPEHCEKGGPAKASSKADIVKYLQDSIEYAEKVLPAIDGVHALDRVDGPYAGPNTRLGIAVTAVWHVSDHYGQLVEYLRLNGIVPPATARMTLPVR